MATQYLQLMFSTFSTDMHFLTTKNIVQLSQIKYFSFLPIYCRQYSYLKKPLLQFYFCLHLAVENYDTLKVCILCYDSCYLSRVFSPDFVCKSPIFPSFLNIKFELLRSSGLEPMVLERPSLKSEASLPKQIAIFLAPSLIY